MVGQGVCSVVCDSNIGFSCVFLINNIICMSGGFGKSPEIRREYDI